MFYIYNVAFKEADQNLGLGSAINVLTDHLDLDHARSPSSAVTPRGRGRDDHRQRHRTRSATGASAARDQGTDRAGAARPRAFSVLTGLFLAATCMVMLSPFIWTACRSPSPPTWPSSTRRSSSTDRRSQRSSTCGRRRTSTSYLINTLVVAVISTVVALAIGLPAAYALSRCAGLDLGGPAGVALIFRALPRFAVVLPMYDIAQSLGLYDTTYALALALIAINQPFTHLAASQLLRRDPADARRGGHDRRLLAVSRCCGA